MRRWVKNTIVGDIGLSATLGGLEQVLCVEPVHKVTATDRIIGELLMSTNKLFFFGQTSSWLASFTFL